MTKLRRNLIRGSALALAGLGSWGAANLVVQEVETRSADAVALVMKTAGHDWAQVTANGLQVQLSGTAPSEAARFRAVTEAGSVVDSKRIIDLMDVVGSAALEAPDFTLEILRNDDGVQLIGLIPAEMDREALVEDLKDALHRGEAGQVVDLLETADYPVPDGWARTVRYAVDSLSGIARAKVSVGTGRVAITAITDSAAEKARIEGELTRRKPDEVVLSTDISAPRPVITPFTLRFLKDGEGARFDACAAGSEEGRARILAAAAQAGAEGALDCTLALGAPSRDWPEAAVQAIDALDRLGEGSVTFTDADISLIAAESTEPALFDQVVGSLESNLPDVFSLSAELLEMPTDEAQGPREFVAELTDEGGIALSGRVADPRQRDAIEAYARARFGSDKVDLALRVDEGLPDGWAVRVLAGLEALGALSSGKVQVQPDMLRVTGVSGDQTASDQIARVLGERAGAGARYELGIAYNRRLDPLLGLPDGPACEDLLNDAVGRAEFSFEPNKYGISGDATPTLEALAKVMTDCADFRIEIGGHTDSQGSEEFNQTLSEGRAEAVLAALTGAGVDSANLSARGYGESQPIASNETEAGRDANRRIEFRLLDPTPVGEGTAAAAPVEVITGTTGETPSAPEEAASAPDAAPDASDAEAGAPPPALSLPDAPPAAILSDAAASETATETDSETTTETTEEMAAEIDGDSLTLDGYTVTITPADGAMLRPSPRP